MQLKIHLPMETLLDVAVNKILAESEDGWFCLKPRHIDCVSVLQPGLLVYVSCDGQECCVGIDEAILVKCGAEVVVSTRYAVLGQDPLSLKAAMLARAGQLDTHEQDVRRILARLEAGVAKRFLALQRGDG